MHMGSIQERRAAEVLAALPCGVDSPALPLPQQLPLEFRQAGHEGQHQPAGRCRGVDTEIENAQMDAPLE